MPRGEKSLLAELGEFILNRFGVDIPAAAWPLESLPDHLKMRISITAPDGRELHSSRDAGILSQASVEAIPAEAFDAYRQKWQRTGITSWDFGDLPQFISSPQKSPSKWIAYPALEAGDDPVKSVSLNLYLHQDKALATHRNGVAGLYKIRFARDLKILKKGLKLPGSFKPAADYFGGPSRIDERLMERVIADLFCKNIRTQNEFNAHAETISPILVSHGQELMDQCQVVLSAYHDLRKEFDKISRGHLGNAAVQNLCADLITALGRLVPDSFINLYDIEMLVHIERYIKALQIRAQRALLDFEKDQVKHREVKIFTDRLDEMLQTLSPIASSEKRKALEDFFWMIEEYKVSIFAQELKTAYPVSKKRLEKKIGEINRMI